MRLRGEGTAKVTLRDVAAAVGVSPATASRALRRPEMVNARIVERIEATCREMNYVPNHAARALTLERSDAIGVIVPLLTNQVFAAMIDGIQAHLDPLGFGLLISCSHRDPDRELAQARSLLMRGVDAIILGNPEHRPETLALLERAAMPYVCAGSSALAPERPMVTYDSAAAMALAVDLVVREGHRRIAVLSGPGATTPVIRDRLDGALARLRRHDAAPPPELVVEADYTPEAARHGAAALLDVARPPSAVICTGDMHAMAMLAEARRRHLHVPRDLSVIGCNDAAIGQFAYPELSSVRTPYAEVGRVAAAQALALARGEPIAPKILLRAELVERASVAPPPCQPGAMRPR